MYIAYAFFLLFFTVFTTISNTPQKNAMNASEEEITFRYTFFLNLTIFLPSIQFILAISFVMNRTTTASGG